MWIGIFIAIVVTLLFFSWGKNRTTPLQTKEDTDSNYTGDGGSYDSFDNGDSSDTGDSGTDGGSGD